MSDMLFCAAHELKSHGLHKTSDQQKQNDAIKSDVLTALGSTV